MDWLTGNKNRNSIIEMQEKRSNLITDVTLNGRHRNTYKRKLKRLNREIERLYYGGLTCLD
jgi:hypothetical protein